MEPRLDSPPPSPLRSSDPRWRFFNLGIGIVAAVVMFLLTSRGCEIRNVAVPANFVAHGNEAYGISIAAPPDWEKRSAPPNSLSTVLVLENRTHTMVVQILVRDLPPELIKADLRRVAEYTFSTTAGELGYLNKARKGRHELGNLKGILYEYVRNGDKGHLVIAPKGSRVFLVYCGVVWSGDFYASEGLARQIFSSFHAD